MYFLVHFMWLAMTAALPYEYGVSPHHMVHPTRITQTKFNNIFIYDTGISSVEFYKVTQLYLRNYKVGKYDNETKKSLRLKRAVHCFTIVFFTICPDNEVKSTKELFALLNGEVRDLTNIVQTQKKMTVLLAKAVKANYDDLSFAIGKLYYQVQWDNERLRSWGIYRTKMEYLQIADDLINGKFPILSIGNQTVQSMREAICRAAPKECQANIPFGAKVLSFGNLGGSLFIFASYNYRHTSESGFKIVTLPRTIKENCYVFSTSPTSFLLNVNKSRMSFFLHETLVSTSPLKFDLQNKVISCLIQSLLVALVNFKDFDSADPYEDLSRFMKTDYAEICFSSYNNTPSVLKIVGSECPPYSPLPGFVWQPKTNLLEFANIPMFKAKPDLIDKPGAFIPKNFSFKNDFDIKQLERLMDQQLNDLAKKIVKTDEKIEVLPTASKNWKFGLGFGATTLVFFLLLAVLLCCGRSLISGRKAMATVLIFLPLLAGAERSDVRLSPTTVSVNCELGVSCPTEGLYQVSLTVVKVEGKSTSVALMTRAVFRCEESTTPGSYKIAIIFILSLLCALIGLIGALLAYLFRTQHVKQKITRSGMIYTFIGPRGCAKYTQLSGGQLVYAGSTLPIVSRTKERKHDEEQELFNSPQT